ncbi:metallophosphoesterase family protein [Lacimonas salitolerans]|uniref:Metallophosphoesterase family protein n=1 Tax=Lacimonas salitolerans TaxID=1323750 RepID=A0ABW4EGQ6_9RHOB
MTRFIHLTDLHLTAPGDNARPAKTQLALAEVIGSVTAMPVPPDFVVISGDLTDTGDAASYALLREALAPLPMPVVLALGNHDARGAFHEGFDTGMGTAPHAHDAVIAGLHVITLDTLVPGRVAGALDDAQLDWLAQALARHSDLPRLVVAHHPPHLGDDALPWATLDVASTARLAQMLQGQGVIGILSGHVHVNRVTQWHGIPVFTNLGLKSTVDLLEPVDMRIVEGTGFGIGTLRPSGLSMSFVPLTPVAHELGRIDISRLRSFS